MRVGKIGLEKIYKYGTREENHKLSIGRYKVFSEEILIGSGRDGERINEEG
jgi:hypothetical protein